MLGDDRASLDSGSALYLTQLSDLKNVNALVGSQTIELNPKLTIVFGENACGKTGHVRVLKKAAAVRASEPVFARCLSGATACPASISSDRIPNRSGH
jgi:hypothetical protein